jgi:hypothetical protein
LAAGYYYSRKLKGGGASRLPVIYSRSQASAGFNCEIQPAVKNNFMVFHYRKVRRFITASESGGLPAGNNTFKKQVKIPEYNTVYINVYSCLQAIIKNLRAFRNSGEDKYSITGIYTCPLAP